jgi:hypothetical protein
MTVRRRWLLWSSILLLAGLLGCSAASPKGAGSSGQSAGNAGGAGQGGSAQAQSEGGAKVIDQELKRHAQMYKEYLQHNADNAKKHQEADRKLLEKMRKQDQKARQDEIKRLQAKQGLLDEEGDTSQQAKSSSGGKTESSPKLR